VKFPFICSRIPAASAYGVYISQLIRYSWACGYYQEQTTQWPKEKGQQDKQWSTKDIHKTKDRVTRTPLIIGDELRCSGRVSSSYSTSDTRRVNLVTKSPLSCQLVVSIFIFLFLKVNYKLPINRILDILFLCLTVSLGISGSPFRLTWYTPW